MDLYEDLKSLAGCVLSNEPMKKHTSFKIGGPADYIAVPENVESLVNTVRYLKKNNICFYVIGNGSNILVKDSGFRGVIVRISDKLSDVHAEESILKAETGILLSKLASIALDKSLSGLEFASGIPGSLGGAIYMNAGAYDGEMAQIVKKVKCYDIENDEIIDLSNEKCGFGYRRSIFQNDKYVILEAEIELKSYDKVKIKERMMELNKARKAKQPLEFPSAGSTFKRPCGNYASKLIDECGLRGFRVGGAMVSDKHTGFVINAGNATADDVLKVVKEVKEKVYKDTKVLLEEEIKILG